MREALPYPEIKEDIQKMPDDGLKKEYQELSFGTEYFFSKILKNGILEGYRPKYHEDLIFQQTYGIKFGKYSFLKKEMNKDPSRKIPAKRKERTISDLFVESCRELEILREYEHRFLPDDKNM